MVVKWKMLGTRRRRQRSQKAPNEPHDQSVMKTSTQSGSEPQDRAVRKLSASVVATLCAASSGCSVQIAASTSSGSSAIARIGCVPNASIRRNQHGIKVVWPKKEQRLHWHVKTIFQTSMTFGQPLRAIPLLRVWKLFSVFGMHCLHR